MEKCALREVFRANKVAAQLATSPSAKLGLIAHSMLEEAAKGSIGDRPSFEELWDANIGKIEEQMLDSMLDAHLVPLKDSAKNYEVKKLQAWNLISAEFIQKRPTININNRIATEEWLQSRSTRIAGRVDLLITDGERVDIIDYKTGSIFDESGCPREEYLVQLKLYAALYHDNKEVWPTRLIIVGIDKTSYQIQYDPEECEKLMAYFSNKLDAINKKIMDGVPNSELASPSPRTCRYCTYRPTCTMYWKTRVDSGEWPNDVEGNIIEKTTSGIGLVRVVLENAGNKYIVRGLTHRHNLGNRPTTRLVICNLTKDNISGQYVENKLTTCRIAAEDCK